MSHADFIHLRVHSSYSLSSGAIKIDELVELCRAERMPAVAVTDINNLFGALEFSEACRSAGVQPILGCELALRSDVGETSVRQTRAEEPYWPGYLVQNETGWRNLMSLASIAHMETPSGLMPQIDFECLGKHSDGLLALSGGPRGPLGRLLLDGQKQAAWEAAKRFQDMFPGRFYIELMRHGMEGEKLIELALIDLAYELNLPLVATNDVYFGPRDKHHAHDVLMCIAQGVHIDDQERARLTEDHCFRSADEMRDLFADLPEAIDNTLSIARRCAFMAPEHKPILPAYPLTEEKRTEATELRVLSEEGLNRRLERGVFNETMNEDEQEAAAKPYRERLNYELDVITRMKFPGYFLIVAEFIRWAKTQNIPVGPGRGSGAGSVVAWALTITDLDPLRFGLIFERFLNPERVSMPDFDIDFCQEKRDLVIEHVCNKYGRDRVAQIITFGKLQARAVIRDVGRVLGMPYGQVDRLSKLVPYNPAKPVSLQQAIDGEPLFQVMKDEDQAVTTLLNIALQLEGLYRHASTHAAGVVIGDRALHELVPLYRDPRSEMPVTQYSMKYVERAGLVKFDFLGLKTLSVLELACCLVRDGGVHIELDTLPLDDVTTYEMLGRGASMGVFQLESSGMRDVLRSMRPDTIEDIIALVALYRPGPMDNIPKFIACKHGEEEPDYMHESLEEILRETYGVIVYQEQVMQIAQVLAGYSLGDADLLRRAMGKKIKAEMDAQRETFVDGAIEKGVEKRWASRIFDQVAKFAGYGFNKSHAAAYALVAYQTAYFKANYAVEFMAASMSFDLRDTDKLAVFRQELERLNVELLPPDINASGANFTVEYFPELGRKAIRYALAAVKNVGDAAMRAVVAERDANGAFHNVFDFTSRLGVGIVNKRQLENLISAGAFDTLESNRRQLLDAVEMLLRHAESAERNSGQNSLFGEGPNMGMPEPELPAVADWPPLERLNHEQEAIGFYLSAHPLETYSSVLGALRITPCAQFAERASEGWSSMTIAGVVLSVQERDSNGRRFAFVQLSDPSGSFEVAFFHEAFSAVRELLQTGRFLLVQANIRSEGDMVKLTAQGAEDLERRAIARMKGLEIHFSESTPLVPLKDILDREGAGACQIRFIVGTPRRGQIEIELKRNYALTPAMRAEIGALPGVSAVHDL